MNKNWRIVFKFKMAMHNPPHAGEFIKEVYLEPLGVSPRSVALRLKVSPSTFSRLIKGQSSISPEMALRLSKCLGRSPESWLLMQGHYDLWQAIEKIDPAGIEPLAVPA